MTLPIVGYIYMATNPHLAPNLVKIGLSTVPVASRMRSLSTTNIPGRYKVENLWLVSDVVRVEAAIHDHFSTARIDPGREFFMLNDIPKAAREIVQIIEKLGATTNALPPLQRAAYKPPTGYRRAVTNLPDVFTLQQVMDALSVDALEGKYLCDRLSSSLGIKQVSEGDHTNTMYIKGPEAYGIRRQLLEHQILDQPTLIYGLTALDLAGWHFQEWSHPDRMLITVGVVSQPTTRLTRYSYVFIDNDAFSKMWENSRPAKPSHAMLRTASPEMVLVRMINTGSFDRSALVQLPPLRKLLKSRLGQQNDVVERCLLAADVLGHSRELTLKRLSAVPFLREQVRAQIDAIMDVSANDAVNHP